MSCPSFLREPLRTLRRRLPRPVGALSFVRPDPRFFLCLFYSFACSIPLR